MTLESYHVKPSLGNGLLNPCCHNSNPVGQLRFKCIGHLHLDGINCTVFLASDRHQTLQGNSPFSMIIHTLRSASIIIIFGLSAMHDATPEATSEQNFRYILCCFNLVS